MSWWTTVLGGALGFMLGGPLGAMLGVAFAGNFSKGKSNFGGFAKDFRPGDQQRVQAAFFSSLFSVMGYIAKGLPEEMIKIANDKTHEIISAYELIKKHRGMR